MAYKKPDRWRNTELEQNCNRMEPGGRSNISAAYQWWLHPMFRRINYWRWSIKKCFLLHHCTCIQICKAGLCESSINCTDRFAQCCIPDQGWQKSVDCIERHHRKTNFRHTVQRQDSNNEFTSQFCWNICLVKNENAIRYVRIDFN